MELHGLTKRQVEIAELLWQCEDSCDVEQVVELYGTDAAIVRELMRASAIDEWVDKQQEFPQVMRFLEKYK